ncbi:hypothetical protein, partial [Marinobacter sp.]|uniref:hypothetical protein n=1 Tax=Marinobacter sp. TaxID=50741 RepID=UPI0023556077
CSIKAAYSTSFRCPVNRFLKKFQTRFLQYFQTVAFRFLARLSGLPLEGDAHSTDPSRGVNA